MTASRRLLAASLMLLAAGGTPALASDPQPERTFCEVYLDLVQNGGCTYDAGQEEAEPVQRQVVRGSLVSPMGSAVTLVGFAPLTTRAAPANGVATWTLEVAPGTVGGPFVLEARGHANLDVVFYDDGYGVNHRAPRVTGSFYTAGVDGERGVVPAGSAVAVVTIAEGSLADFVYTAVPPRGR